MSYVGKSINVITRKGTNKETVVKELKSKGIVRTDAGNEYQITDLFNRGRGVFVDLTAGKSAPAKEKSESKPASTGYVAKAVELSELEGRKIDGVAVARIKRAAKQIVLEDGTVVELADVRRVGKGYTAGGEAPAKAAPKKAATKPAAKQAPKAGGAAKKPAAKAEEIDIRKIKGEEILIDGESEEIVKVFTSGNLKTDTGRKLAVTDLVRNADGVLVLQSDEEEEELEDELNFDDGEGLTVPENISELKGKEIYVDGDPLKVVAINKSKNQVRLSNDQIIDVSSIEVEDDVFVAETPRSSVIPKREFPLANTGKMPVVAFDGESAADIADFSENAVRAAMGKKFAYDIPLITSIAVAGDEFLCVGLYFATTDATESEIAAKIAEIRKSHGLGAPSQVVAAASDDEPQFDAEDEDEEEEEDDEASTEFDFEEEEEETNVEELIANSVEALHTMFGVNAKSYVERWFASEEAMDSIGTDILPGITTLEQDGAEYVLFGLDNKDNIVVVKTTKNDKGNMVRLDNVTMASLSRMEEVA